MGRGRRGGRRGHGERGRRGGRWDRGGPGTGGSCLSGAGIRGRGGGAPLGTGGSRRIWIHPPPAGSGPPALAPLIHPGADTHTPSPPGLGPPAPSPSSAPGLIPRPQGHPPAQGQPPPSPGLLTHPRLTPQASGTPAQPLAKGLALTRSAPARQLKLSETVSFLVK